MWIQQVKVPVSDLQRSVTWYRTLFELELTREYVERGEVRGAVLSDRDAGFLIALMHRDDVADNPAFTGFELFCVGVPSTKTLLDLADRCTESGIPHGELLDRGQDGAQLDIPDPDGTVIRFLSPIEDDGPAFAGIELGVGGRMTFYDAPRLAV